MSDKRIEKTKASIEEALLSILESKYLSQITVADIAREAGISRSTFYAHFASPEEVYLWLVKQFAEQTQSLPTQLRNGNCTDCASKTLPFCAGIILPTKWHAFVRDPQFLEMFFMVTENAVNSESAVMYRKLDISELEAIALFRFQISGCYYAALTFGESTEWGEVRDLIDEFIRGGVNAIRSRF